MSGDRTSSIDPGAHRRPFVRLERGDEVILEESASERVEPVLLEGLEMRANEPRLQVEGVGDGGGRIVERKREGIAQRAAQRVGVSAPMRSAISSSHICR